MKESFSQTRLRHRFQTALLILGMSVVFALVSFLVAGWAGLLLALGMIAAFWVFAMPLAPQLALRVFRAEPLRYEQAPEIYHIVRTLCERARIQTIPRLYLIRDPIQLNAFSTGTKKQPVIALSQALLWKLHPREIRGVLAHELAHIESGDLTLVSTMQLLARGVRLFAWVTQLIVLINIPLILLGWVQVSLPALLLIAIAPTVLLLMQMKLSRTREFQADSRAVEMTQDPEGLASALLRISSISERFAALLPFSIRRKEPPTWLKSHPPTDERIRRIARFSFDRLSPFEHSRRYERSA